MLHRFNVTKSGTGMDFETIIQQPNVRRKYPHMMPEDTVVWTKFLQTQNFGIEGVWYDVHVGTPATATIGEDEVTRKIREGLTRKRIDVVAQVGGGYWVVEVKPRADSFAIGQVIMYARMFVRQFRPDGAVVPIIICDEVDKDILPDLDSLGVGVIQNAPES